MVVVGNEFFHDYLKNVFEKWGVYFRSFEVFYGIDSHFVTEIRINADFNKKKRQNIEIASFEKILRPTFRLVSIENGMKFR